jgi:hypothetical protein
LTQSLPDNPHLVSPSTLLQILQRLGINDAQLSDANALLAMCQWNAFDLNGNPSAPRQQSPSISVRLSDLSQWLGCLGSYRYLQKKLQVCMRILSQSTAEFLRQLNEAQLLPSNPQLTLEIFLSFLTNTDLPLSRAEALSIGRLLVRQQEANQLTPQRQERRGGEGRFRRQRREGEELNQSVDTSLLENIRRGNYLSAAL